MKECNRCGNRECDFIHAPKEPKGKPKMSFPKLRKAPPKGIAHVMGLPCPIWRKIDPMHNPLWENLDSATIVKLRDLRKGLGTQRKNKEWKGGKKRKLWKNR